MSAVLQKKLESSGGLPPSVLQNRAFWMNLETAVAGWVNEMLGGENEVRMQSREVCRGAALADDLFGAYLYGFHSESCDFVVAVSVDNVMAAQFAAKKMQQDPAALAEAPQLFLQLLLEAPATRFTSELARAFAMTGADDELPQPVAFDKLEVEGSCLMVYYLCDVDGQAVRIGVALKLDKVISYASTAEDGVANAEASSKPTSAERSGTRVQNSSVQLNIILDRVPMSVADCSRLEPGTIITLPGTHRSKLTVSAKTVDGPVDIAIGELGVWKHQRAVRLKTEIEPSFLQEVAVA